MEATEELTTGIQSSPNIRYKVDYWRDDFIIEAGEQPRHWQCSGQVDTVGLEKYTDWVEYEHAKNKRENKPDSEWYDKRIGWISTIQSMFEQEDETGEETEESDEEPE